MTRGMWKNRGRANGMQSFSDQNRRISKTSRFSPFEGPPFRASFCATSMCPWRGKGNARRLKEEGGSSAAASKNSSSSQARKTALPNEPFPLKRGYEFTLSRFLRFLFDLPFSYPIRESSFPLLPFFDKFRESRDVENRKIFIFIKLYICVYIGNGGVLILWYPLKHVQFFNDGEIFLIKIGAQLIIRISILQNCQLRGFNYYNLNYS